LRDDFVGEDQLRENGPGVKSERGAVAIVNRHADDVGRQHVAGELYAVKTESKQFRQHLRERGLADAGQVLDQRCRARAAGERKPDLRSLPRMIFPACWTTPWISE